MMMDEKFGSFNEKVDPRTVINNQKIIQYILKVSLVDSSENIKQLIIFAYFLDDFIIRMSTHQSFGKNKHSEVQKR